MQPSTQAKWRNIIAKQKASSLTILEFCKQANMSQSVFYQRRRELIALEKASSHFVKASVTKTLEISNTPSSVVVTKGDVEIKLPL